MHQVIRVIVSANDKDEAIEKACYALEDLVERGIYDSFVLFNENIPGFGKVRWGNYPAVAELKEPEKWKEKLALVKLANIDPTNEEASEELRAWAILNEGIEFTVKCLKEDLKRVRKALNEYSDEDFWKGGKDIDMVKFWMHCIGCKHSRDYFLYDEYGQPIMSEEALAYILEKSKRLFIVPADVHFRDG